MLETLRACIKNLCKRQLNTNDLKIADALLLRFCSRFQSLYGCEAVTPNIHLHAHLCDCVADYGPLSSFWLFSFERFNGILGDEPTNNRSVELQLMSRFVKDNSHLRLMCTYPFASSDTATFSPTEYELLSDIYTRLHPEYKELYLPRSNRKMLCITKFVSSASENSVYNDPDIRPAKVLYFFIH